MSDKPENPPAFPMPATEQHHFNQNPLKGEHGMTLRDYFAAAALQSITASLSAIQNFNDDKDRHKFVAGHAFCIADAMLAEREK